MPAAKRRAALLRLVGSLALILLLARAQTQFVSAMPIGPESPDLQPGRQHGMLPEGASAGEDFSTARTTLTLYEAQSGDTLWSIAAQFDLDVDTLRWSNPELVHNPDYLQPGQQIIVIPLRGAYVTVEPGDTLERLAERWGVAPADIGSYPLNRLRPGEEPAPGAKLVIPHGVREVVLAPPGPAAGYTYAWPIRGYVTQNYRSGHHAVDLGAPYGAKVYAARAGRCIFQQWSAVGYGYLVIVDHGDGSQAYYSHLKGAWVHPGEWVERGGLVGEVGSTGNSTGPHVHFEIRVRGVNQNPLQLLPPKP